MRYIYAIIFSFLFVGTVTSQANGSLNFYGDDDYISFPYGPDLANSSFTIEMWAKKPISTDGCLIRVGFAPFVNESLQVGFSSSNVFSVDFFDNELSIAVSDDPLWHHWAVTYDASAAPGIHNRKIYRDGVLIASDESLSDFIGTATMEMGRNNATANASYFAGSVDILKIWTKALTEVEISSMSLCPSKPENTAGLYEQYLFSDGVPNSNNNPNYYLLTPSSFGGALGTLHNFALNGTTSNWIDDSQIVFPYLIEPSLDQNLVLGEELILAPSIDLGTCPSNYPARFWIKDGITIPNENDLTLVIDNATIADEGEYYLKILDLSSTREFITDTITVARVSTFEAKDQVSDYYIDVDWTILPDQCLYDSNDQPYDIVTTRLLRNGEEIFYQTYEEEELEDIYTNNTDILGTYRDYVGPDTINTYEMMVYVGPFGQTSDECGSFSDEGSTSSVQVPTNFTLTENLLDRINVTWVNNSDLVTSFKLFRDGSLITTITNGIEKGDSSLFADIFNFNSSSSIKSGKDHSYSLEMNSSFYSQSWNYPVGVGNTLDIDFSASQTETDQVQLDWLDAASSLIDGYKLYRKNKLFATKSINQTNHLDIYPHYGDTITYQLRLIKADTVRAAYNGLGYVPPNGSLSGRVVTKEGQYPIRDQVIHAIRVGTGDTLTTISNATGDFLFTNMSYGLLAEYKLHTALVDHNFTYFPTQTIALSSNKPNITQFKIVDDFTYPQGSTMFQLEASVMPFNNQDKAEISWTYTSDPTELFLDISRNGDIIYASSEINPSPNTTGTFTDLGGSPDEDTKYTVRIYDILGNALSSLSKEISITHPKVSRIPDTNFTAIQETANAVETGNIALQWTHTSQNIDGFRIYRNDSLITELAPNVLTYIDSEAPFGVNLYYQITAIRNLENTTYETTLPTASTPAFINLGTMPSPLTVSATGEVIIPSMVVNWTIAPNIAANFDYTGYCIYRNDSLLRKQDKTLPLSYEDYGALGLTNITYKVSLYRATENGMIESNKALSNTLDHPPIFPNVNLDGTAVPAEGLINLSLSQVIPGSTTNSNGYILYYEGSPVVKLPAYITEYKVYPPSGSNHVYKLYKYKTINGVDILSSISNNTFVIMSELSGTVYAPQNVMASRDLPNHIKLCWDYLDFVESSFEITKDNIIIDTLPVGTRTFYDYNANPTNHMVDYKVRALNSGQVSKYVGSVGDVVGHKLIYGQITDPDTKLGIANVTIFSMIDGLKNVEAQTDSSGYYSFPIANELIGTSFTINAYYSSSLQANSNVTISSDKHYEVNMELDIPEVFPYNSIATIEYVNIDIDKYDLSGIISWQPSNSNYDGVEVSRGLNVLGNVLKVDGNLFVDTTAVPGIAYRYVFRTYQTTNQGKKFAPLYKKDCTYPPIAPVINLTATPLVEENAIQIQWSHLYDHADGYGISRNGVLIKDFLAGSPFTFKDSTGTAGEQYTYTLVAYKQSGNQLYSSEEKTVSAIYPQPAKIKNLSFSFPFIEDVIIGNAGPIIPNYHLNHVKLTWDYNPYFSSGFHVFRDNQLIATVPADSLVYRDYNGNPGETVTYAVSAMISQDGVENESKKASNNTTFPVLQTPYGFTFSSGAVGFTTVSWKYRTPGVDFFELDVIENSIIIRSEVIQGKKNITGETTFQYLDKTTLPGTGLPVKYELRAVSTRNNIDYKSNTIETAASFYSYPSITNCDASKGTFDMAVKVTWDSPAGVNVDSFSILKYTIPGGILVDEFVVEKGKRSYVDLFEEGDILGNFEYKVQAGKITNGIYAPIINPQSECISEGYPNSINGVDGQEVYNCCNGFGNAVAVDKEWMVVGNHVNSSITIFKFENEAWTQNKVITGSGSFGYAVDIDDKIIVVGAPELDQVNKKGKVSFYRLNGQDWQLDQTILGDIDNGEFGTTVAVDNGKIIVGQGYVIDFPAPYVQPFIYQQYIRVFDRGACSYSTPCAYSEIMVNIPALLDFPMHEDSIPYFPADTLGPTSIDIDGNDIVLGHYLAYYKGQGSEGSYGRVSHLKISGNSVDYKALFTDLDSYQSGYILEFFGWDVEIQSGKIAASSINGKVNNINSGKVSVFEEISAGNWEKSETILPSIPTSGGVFGYEIKTKGDFLGITEPFFDASNNTLSNIYLFKENPNGFQVVHSPDPSNSKYREVFHDSGSPDLYPNEFSTSFDISDNHLVAGSPTPGATRFYSFDLFDVKINNLSASDGIHNSTKLTWELGGCADCPANYISSYNIYRDAILIDNVSANSIIFLDEITGSLEATSGKEYIYEVEAIINFPYDLKSPKSLDTGYSKRKGRITGDVLVSGSSSGVPGVTIEITGADLVEQTTFSYQTTSLSNGSFVFNNLYVGNSIDYTISASYLDHDLEVNGDNPIYLDVNTPEQNGIIISDNTAFVVSGQVLTQSTECGIQDIRVNYYETINGIETLRDTTRTDEDGNYSLIVDPNKVNLSEIRVNIDNLQTSISEQGESSSVQYDFFPSESIFNEFDNFPITNTVDFEDQLTYPITVSVENTCGFPLANQPVLIRVSSTDGCLEYNQQTDNFGEFVINLSPKKYLLAVEGIVGSGVDNYENAGIDYLSLRPVTLDLLGIHMEAGDSDTLPTIPPVKYVYHRAVNFAYTSSFVEFKCNDMQQPALITQGDKHNLNFILSENHRPGESCEVTEGYIVVINSGASKLKDTLQLIGGAFETYQFTVGLPNLVAPHTWAISLQYFSDKGSLLGSKIIPIIVEGQRLLPGTGIITDALTDDAGDLQMPLLVLRDPPGDGSYSSIESGTNITKSLDFGGEASGSIGFYLQSSFTIFGAGLFTELDIGVGGSTSNRSAIDFSISTSETYSTSSSDNAIGREANVIVGAGISSQYGLTQVLSFGVNNCTPTSSQILSFGIGGFNSTYGYTVAFIEGLIDEYQRDSLLVEMELLQVTRPDGSFYSKEEARLRFNSLIDTWQEMLHYHDVETVPHFVLCQDFSYRNDLSPETQALYEGWKDEFCTQIGSYDANDNFLMNDEIVWTPALISAYNNVIAFTDAIKEVPLDYVDNGDLDVTSFDITANNLNVTNQFHNTLGNAAKSAEVFDISGNVNFDRTITAQQSSSTTKSFSRYFYLDSKFGAQISVGSFAGFGVTNEITDIEISVGAHLTTKATLSVNSSQANSNQSTISYHIFDDDPEDQVTFLALQAPLQDQTPFFIRLGGLSSCPQEEALTINQDNSPLLIDDPTITVIIDPVSGAASPSPPPVYNVDPEEAAIFEVQMGNLGPTGLARDAKIFLDLESNPFGAIIKIGGSNLNQVSPVFGIPAGGSITQFLTVERPSGTPFYVFEGLRIGIEPACGGEAKYIKLDVIFESPCSPISITKPFDGYIVKRINPFIQNDREVIPYELRDFQANNLLLEHVQLQYKRLGAGTDWQNVPSGRIERQTLLDTIAGLPVGQDPLYLFNWDITGEYSLYPDGQYRVRAFAFCGVSGRQYSNETNITLARSALLITGYPEPANGIWTAGNEISTTYSTDIDCGIYNVLDNEDILDYLTLMDLETMMPVPFTHACQNNKLTISPIGDMSLYDGHTLRATYKDITNIIGNPAQVVIWDFKVITQLVDWEEPIIELTLYENEVKTVNTLLFNSTANSVNGLTLSGTESWYSFNPTGTFLVPGDGTLPVELTFNGNLGEGTYMSTLQVNGLVGRVPTVVVKLTVLQSVPTPNITGPYTDSMELIMNWSFLDPYLVSSDVNDVIQVYKDGLIRGYATIEEQGNFYFARIKVYGNAVDENGKLDFVIWNANEPQGYVPIASTNITFKANTTRGVLTLPEILLVDDDLFEFRGRIYVDSMNIAGVQDGKSWLTAFSDLQDALSVAYDADTIWMAGGTYFPSVGDKTVSFVLNESIAILGGFQNGMSSAGQRTGNDETILSGNVGIKATATDNSYHVVRASAPNILFDMLSISDGNASGTLDNSRGGCLYNTGQLTLLNCSMFGGQADQAGSLIYNNGSLFIDGGIYYIPATSTVSNLHNDVNGSISIMQSVNIQKE